MHLIFASFKKLKKHEFNFASFKKLKKHEFNFLQIKKAKHNINLIFPMLKKLKNMD